MTNALRHAELEYWRHAVDLVADMLSSLRAEELEGRRDKLVTTLRAASHRASAEERPEYQAALKMLPDSLERPLARRIEILLENVRRESHIGCELRRELDGGIERDAKAIEAQWPDAAAFLRSHAHIEDGV